jgi:acetyl esterase
MMCFAVNYAMPVVSRLLLSTIGWLPSTGSALIWIAANAADLGIDAKRLAVGGDSAGGNLAAVVALQARDEGGPALRLQLLIYPAVDFAMSGGSYVSEAEILPLTDKAMFWFHDLYLASAKSAASHDWRASPLRAASHAGLPAAFVLTAQHDVLRDEGKAYAVKLQDAGVAVEHVLFPGMIHGFITMGRIIGAANTAVVACATALKTHLA